MDGAMGTQLQLAGMPSGACYEQWNLTQPSTVEAIHRAYVDAGADILLTNTFQANPVALAKHGLAAELEAICEAGIALARNAAGGRAFVLASIGPCKGLHDPLDRLAIACRHADALLLETLSDPFPLGCLASSARKELPILLSYTYYHSPKSGLRTWTGWTPEEIAVQSARQQVAALGVNCGREISLDDTVEIVRRYREATRLPLFAKPNAGTPTIVDGKAVYPVGPEEMAARLPEFVDAGARMIGGCCGTTPEYIATIRRSLGDLEAT
jgi:5-methyltetrahydrofolate--homocysteine methyltransferase